MSNADVSRAELDLLADLDAGVLQGAERQRAEVLARSDRGRAVLSALGRVRDDLRALPEPVLPARWSSVLAAVGAEAPVPAVREVPTGRARARWRTLPLLAATSAAAVAVLGVAGSVLGPQEFGPGSGPSSAPGTESAGSSAQSEQAPGAAAAPEAVPEEGRAGDAAADSTRGAAGGPSEPPVIVTGREYLQEDLPTTVGALPSTAALAAGVPVESSAPELARLRDPAALRACVAAVAGTSVPLVIEFARFQGSPALVIALPGPVPGEVVSYAVGPACSAARPDILSVSP